MWSWYSSEGCLPVPQEPMAGFGVSEPLAHQGLADKSAATESSMMSNIRRIPEAEWQVYKEEIEVLYLTKNKSREDVMAAMEKTHGFQASKSQYIRKLEQWGFKKKSTDENWKFIARKLQKRDLEGKESDTYINGKLVPRKKVKKEVSRHSLPSWQIMSIAGRSPPPPGGIEIRSPPREHDLFVQYLHIPWFGFEALLEPQINRIVALARGHHKTPSLVNEQPAQRSHNPLTRASSPRMATVTDQDLHQTTAPWSQFYGAVQRLGNDQRAQNSISPIQVRREAPGSISASPHEEQARSLFVDILGKSINPNSHGYLSTVMSQLDNILIERQEGDVTGNLKRFFGSSTFEITLQLLRYSIYLSSNNLLREDQTDKLLLWVVRNGQFATIEHLITLKTATTEVFASNTLLSATRTGHNQTVQALITLGIDVNIPGGCFPKDTALLAAVRKSTKLTLWVREEDNFPLIMLLLDAGADINAKSGPNNTSPLQEVISKKHVRLVQIFLSFGTILGSLATKLDFPDTALIKAARDGDYNLIKRLLDAKARLEALAQPFMITLLQDAAKWHGIDTVQALLDLGADVNAPAGVTYATARKEAVESNNLRRLQSAIQIAAYRGEIEMVQVLLESGASVDGYLFTQEECSACESATAQHFERDYGYQEEYDNSEFNPNLDFDGNSDCCGDTCDYRPHFHWTPLQSAVECEDTVLVRVLLLAGADIEGRDPGLTPLQLAVLKNNAKLVMLILKNGAAVNAPARGYRGRTALQMAIENGNTDLVEILMAAGSNLNAAASPNSGLTALQAAARVNNIELVNKLISLGAEVNAAASPINGCTCLQAAAANGNYELVRILLNSGAEVNAAAAAKYGLTALQAAASEGHLSVVKILLAAGADVHTPGAEGGHSAVSAAVMGNNLEIVQLFLKTASPNGQSDPLPPLHRASRQSATTIVQCLIQAGANINSLRTDKPSLGYGYPCTALEEALQMGSEDIPGILLDAGADLNCQVPGLRAALGAASIGWRYHFKPINMDIARKLLKAGADVNRAFSSNGMPLQNAVYCGRRDLVQMLLDAGADVNGRAPDGNTALRNAVRKGDIDISQVLLNAGADINAFAPTEKGRTALQDAAECGHTTVVRLLLERGADCNASAAVSKGLTALQAAAIGGHLPIALMLLKAGANINASAAKSNGRRALEAAAEHGRLDIVSLLLKNDTDTDGLKSTCEEAAKLAEGNGHIFISRMLRAHKKD